MERKRVVILTFDDWEGLFVDGKLVSEDHHLGGNDKLFLLKMAEQYKFTSKDIVTLYLGSEDVEYLEDHGSFPDLLSDLKGTYDKSI